MLRNGVIFVMKIRHNHKNAIKAAASNDVIYVIMNNGDPIAKGTYDAMTKKSYDYPYPVQIKKFPKAKLNSLMKMAKEAHRPDPLKFAVNRFINDYSQEYTELNASTKAVNASWGGWGKFYGLNDVEFTVPNDTDDPTIFYNGKYYNYYDIEDTLWDYYKDECNENGVKPDENDFENWVANNSYYVYDLLDEITPKSEPGRGVYREKADTLRGPVKSSRMSARRRAIKSARTLEIYTYDELTPEQQQYVLNNWSNMRKLADVIYDWFDEDEMFIYNDEKQFIADKYANMYGLDINSDKTYWQSSSQGPYPEWSLDQVFDTYCGETTTGIPYCIEFYGRGLDVQCSLDTDGYYDEGEPTESDIDAKLGMPIGEIMQGAQQYIDELWNLINNVCQAYPDDEWVRETIEANPDSFEFTVSDDGTVKYF